MKTGRIDEISDGWERRTYAEAFEYLDLVRVSLYLDGGVSLYAKGCPPIPEQHHGAHTASEQSSTEHSNLRPSTFLAKNPGSSKRPSTLEFLPPLAHPP